MRKETTKVVAIIAVALVVIAIVFNSGDSSKEIDFVKEAVNNGADFNGEQFKGDFVEGCSEDGDATYKECACMYDYIVDQKNGFDSMLDMSLRIIKGTDITDKQAKMVLEAVYSCS